MNKLFAVVLHEPNLEVEERLEETYPIHYKYTETFYLVSVGRTVFSEEIAEAVGIKGDRRIEDSSGVVFRVNSAYSGYTKRTLWEWLSSELEGD